MSTVGRWRQLLAVSAMIVAGGLGHPIAVAQVAPTASLGIEDAAPFVPRVQRVWTAASDVRAVATYGERTLLATSGGLVVRRGGERERLLTAADGLPGVRLRSLSEVSNGVWVGGVEGAVRVAADSADHLVVAERLALRRLSAVAEMGEDTYFATFGDGLFRRTHGNPGPLVRISLGRHGAHLRLTSLAVDDDRLWVGTSGAGIIVVDAGHRVVDRIGSARGLPDAIVWDLERDDGRMWVGTMGGLCSVVDARIERAHPAVTAAARLPVADVRAVARVGEGLFLATFGGGAYRLSLDGSVTGRDRLRRLEIGVASDGRRSGSRRGDPGGGAEDQVFAVAATAAGVVVGHGAGATLMDPAGLRVATLEGGGLPSGDITAVAPAFGDLWIATFQHGLSRLRRPHSGAARIERVERAHTRFQVDQRINDLAVASHEGAERLWIATDRGLYWYDGIRFSPAVGPGAPGAVHVTALHVDPAGVLWAATSRALIRVEGDHFRSFAGDSAMPVAHLQTITTDRSGRLWIGSLHGLLRFDERSGRFARHTVATGALPVDWVTALAPHGAGVVVGTYHGGLSWYDGSQFQIERESPRGLPAGWVNPRAMAWAGNRLFVGTLERGLLVGRRGAWRHLRTADGLPSDDVTAVVRDGDRAMWVATRGGLARLVW